MCVSIHFYQCFSSIENDVDDNDNDKNDEDSKNDHDNNDELGSMS